MCINMYMEQSSARDEHVPRGRKRRQNGTEKRDWKRKRKGFKKSTVSEGTEGKKEIYGTCSIHCYFLHSFSWSPSFFFLFPVERKEKNGGVIKKKQKSENRSGQKIVLQYGFNSVGWMAPLTISCFFCDQPKYSWSVKQKEKTRMCLSRKTFTYAVRQALYFPLIIINI